MKLRNSLFILSVVLFAACTVFDTDSQLEDALDMAGDNRTELEKVLEHYEGDSLKLEAAKFLIRNMPGHYSYADTSVIVKYSHEVDSILKSMHLSTKQDICKAIDSCALQHNITNQRVVSDIKIIKANYLIRNIDDAFKQWEQGNWAHHLTFDEFCEYLLPYKIEELQLLDDWRYRLKNFHTQNLHELEYCDLFSNSTLTACKQVNNNLHDSINPDHSLSVRFPIMRIESSSKIPFGTCDNYAVIASAVMMSVGIPIVRDFTPQWAFRNLGHSWNVVLSNDGKKIPFSGVCTTPGEPHKLEEKMAKAYRHTYAMNTDIIDLNKKSEFVPPLFRNFFIKDVTREYIACKDVTIKTGNLKESYVYLAVFDDKEWSPIAFARNNNGKATFSDIGLNSMYQVISYDENGKVTMIDEPFILRYDGTKKYLRSDNNKSSMTLMRKYPVLEYVYWYLTRLEGGEFQASNDEDFKNYTLIHKIKDCYAVGYDINVPDSVPAFRYWRYFSDRKGGLCSMAEITFYDKTDKPMKGRIIGTEGSLWNLPDRTKDKVFDGDILSFYEASSPDLSWVGMDFGKPVKVDHFFYIGRGDGNNIEKGDEYELLHWKEGKWVTIEIQLAKKSSLQFNKVPSNGLYLLRNLTKGNDQRIFTYENGKQIWW